MDVRAKQLLSYQRFLVTFGGLCDGSTQVVDVAASDAEPLVGMGLLYGFMLQIEAVEGGRVTIEAL